MNLRISNVEDIDDKSHIIILMLQAVHPEAYGVTVKPHWPRYFLISGNAVPSLGPL